jgi:3D-(3,5/4)-trihydroxycyclohexane-1,2-dione acylhydrolase (decyclizing)
MGYEIPGGMGVKLAAPEREVFVMIGDGSYLMLPGELPTAVAEGIKLVIVLVQNHGYSSIGALSRSIGSGEFGTHYAPGPDLATNAESLGARVIRARTIDDVRAGLLEARAADGPVVVHVEVDRYEGVPGYESWWDVPVAEVSDDESVRAAREEYERNRQAQRRHVAAPHDPSVVAP